MGQASPVLYDDVPELPYGTQYVADSDLSLHVLWLRLAWVVRKTGDTGLARVLAALTVRGFSVQVFTFFLPQLHYSNVIT